MCFHGDVTVSTFSFPTTILFGAGAVGRLPEELSKRGISRPLLVTDAGLARTPVFARVASLAPGAVVFSVVEPRPPPRSTLDGLASYQQNRCNGIVGVGGGSPLDAAKAIRLKVPHELPLAEYHDLLDGADRISANVPPYIAIATTSGTGSEVSRSTVITITATNRKTVVFSPHLIPVLAIADPELTLDLMVAGQTVEHITFSGIRFHCREDHRAGRQARDPREDGGAREARVGDHHPPVER